MIKWLLRIITTIVCLLVLFYLVFIFTVNDYKHKHVMVYKPTDEEELLIAEEFGINLEGIEISDALLSYANPDREYEYAIRITGAEDLYTFLTQNIDVDGVVSIEEDVVSVDGVPICVNNEVFNYEGDEAFVGASIPLRIWGGHSVRDNGNPFRYTLSFTFFYSDGELAFIECASGVGAPFDDRFYNSLIHDEYWKDYVFYPIRPLF